MNIIFPPDCHNPRNEACPHNDDIGHSCACAPRERVRKPFRVVRVRDNYAPALISPEIVISIHPNGVLSFREKGRRKSYEINAGAVLSQLVWKDARKIAATKKKRRK